MSNRLKSAQKAITIISFEAPYLHSGTGAARTLSNIAIQCQHAVQTSGVRAKIYTGIPWLHFFDENVASFAAEINRSWHHASVFKMQTEPDERHGTSISVHARVANILGIGRELHVFQDGGAIVSLDDLLRTVT